MGSDWSDLHFQSMPFLVLIERKWEYCMYIVAMELSVAVFLLLLIGCLWLVALYIYKYSYKNFVMEEKESFMQRISLCSTGKIIRHS